MKVTDELRNIYQNLVKQGAKKEYQLSDNQIRFCEAVTKLGLSIDFNYSGKCMFGRICPAVVVDDLDYLEIGRISTNNLPIENNRFIVYAVY